MSRKYELTDETIMFEDTVLYRIRALKDIPGAVKGDLGGFVRSEENLSQEGDCWIFPESKVVGNSKVSGDATILGEVTIFNDVNITDRAMINGNLIIADNVEISGKSNIFIESGIIRNKVKICDNVVISGKMRISNNVEISDNTVLLGNLKISDNSIIKSKYDFMIFKEFGGNNDDVIWTRSNDKWNRFGLSKAVSKDEYKETFCKDNEYSKKLFDKWVETVNELNEYYECNKFYIHNEEIVNIMKRGV